MSSDRFLVSRDGSDLLVELPTDPFSESNWSNVSWPFIGPPLGRGRHTAKQKSGPGPFSEIRISKPITATLTSDDAEGDLRAFIRDQEDYLKVQI